MYLNVIPSHSQLTTFLYWCVKNRGSQPSWHQGLVSWKTIFPWRGGAGGMVSGWFKCCYIYNATVWSDHHCHSKANTRWSFTGCLLLTSSCAPWFLGCLVKKMKFLPPTCYTYMLLSIFTSVRWCTPMKIHSIGLQYLHWTISLNGREGKIFFKKLFFYFTWCWE